jgi:hypothetical protein
MALLARRFARLPAIDEQAEQHTLDALDNALRAVCHATQGALENAQREALAALSGMRRDLFPRAPAWRPSTPPVPAEIR